MLFLWSRSNKVGSRLIRWGTGEDVSHFAVCFFENRGESAPLIESRGRSGVQLLWLGDFMEQNEIVYALRFEYKDRAEEARMFHDTSKRLREMQYDYHGIFYWMWVLVKKKLFGHATPVRNEWGSDERVYCVEVMQEMAEFLLEIGIDISKVDLEMTTPGAAFRLLETSAHLSPVDHWFV